MLSRINYLCVLCTNMDYLWKLTIGPEDGNNKKHQEVFMLQSILQTGPLPTKSCIECTISDIVTSACPLWVVMFSNM